MTENRARIQDRAMVRGAALAAALAGMTTGCGLYFDGDRGEGDGHSPPDDPSRCSTPAEPNLDFPELPIEPVNADRPPPPISGGTLGITPDERVAVVADPDRDQIYVVSLETASLAAAIALTR